MVICYDKGEPKTLWECVRGVQNVYLGSQKKSPQRNAYYYLRTSRLVEWAEEHAQRPSENTWLIQGAARLRRAAEQRVSQGQLEAGEEGQIA